MAMPLSPRAYEAPACAVDTIHRAVGCFYGMLSVLQQPLTRFVASTRATAPKLPPEIESQSTNLAKMGVRAQLLFVRDHWATHFSMILPVAALADVKWLLQVQQQIHFSAATSVKSYYTGLGAIERLLHVVGASASTAQQAQTLKRVLSVCEVDVKPLDSLISAPSAMVDGLSSGNRRLVLTHQARQIMEAHGAVVNGGDAVDVAAFDHAIELLTSALALTSTPTQRCRIFAMRSECHAVCGRTDRACEDGQAALATQCELTKWTAVKLVGVFKAVSKWSDVAATCALALQSEPNDEELLKQKALALAMTQSASGAESLSSLVDAEQDQGHVRGVASDAEKREEDAVKNHVGMVVDERDDANHEMALQWDAADPAEDFSGESVVQFEEPPDCDEVQASRVDVTPSSDGKRPNLTAPYLAALLQKTKAAKTTTPRTTVKKASKELRAAKLCVDQQEYEEAIFWIDKELLRTKKKPHTHASLYVLRAQCQFQLAEYERAVEDAQAASRLDRTLAESFRWTSAALLKLGRLSEAHSACSAGRKLDPSHEPLKLLEKEITRRSLAAHASRVAAKTLSTPSVGSSASVKDDDAFSTDQEPVELPAWKTAVKIGWGFMQKGNLTAAQSAFTEALALIAREELPTNSKVNVLGHLARCRLSMKRYELALGDAHQILQLKPEWLEGHRLVCKSLMGLERWPEALKECDVVLQGAPQYVPFRTIRTEITAKLSGLLVPTGMVDVAPKCSWNPPQLQACVHAGLLHVEKKSYADAETCFTKALSALKKFKASAPETVVNQSRVKVFGHRARCRLAMENWQGAAEDARVCIHSQPNWIEAYRLLCHALMGSGQWHKARDACQHVLLHAPRDVVFAQIQAKLELKCAGEVIANADHESAARSVVSPENSSMSGASESDAEQSSQQDSEPGLLDTSAPSLGLTTQSSATETKTELLALARGGSIVAQRYLAAQKQISLASELAERGDLRLTIEACRDALQLWPQIEIPQTVHWVWEVAGALSSIAWGGPMLYFHIEATKRSADLKQDNVAEREFWRQAVDQYPEDAQLQSKLARVLYNGAEMGAALGHTEKVLALVTTSEEKLLSTCSWHYLRACCTVAEASSSSVHDVLLASEQSTRENRLLAYVAQSPVDDEWMPHALYALGVLSVAKGDYVRAKQLHCLAQQAESRRDELGLFAAVDESAFLDKRTLTAALSGRLAVQTENARQETHADGMMTCAWCESKAIPVDQYFLHKTRECAGPHRPVCPAAWM